MWLHHVPKLQEDQRLADHIARALCACLCPGTDYMQCAMESIPLPDNSMDVVMSVYAFHEMPEEARAAAAAEFFRWGNCCAHDLLDCRCITMSCVYNYSLKYLLHYFAFSV